MQRLPERHLCNQQMAASSLKATISSICLSILQVLQRMGYLNRDQSVTMKGRVACEVNSGAHCCLRLEALLRNCNIDKSST